MPDASFGHKTPSARVAYIVRHRPCPGGHGKPPVPAGFATATPVLHLRGRREDVAAHILLRGATCPAFRLPGRRGVLPGAGFAADGHHAPEARVARREAPHHAAAVVLRLPVLVDKIVTICGGRALPLNCVIVDMPPVVRAHPRFLLLTCIRRHVGPLPTGVNSAVATFLAPEEHLGVLPMV